MLVVNVEIQVPLRELNFSFARSSGPGGQNVNKLNTKATLRWDVQATSCLPEDVKQRFFAQYRRRITKKGQLVLASQRFRDQGRNVADCLEEAPPIDPDRRFATEVAQTDQTDQSLAHATPQRQTGQCPQEAASAAATRRGLNALFLLPIRIQSMAF